MAFFGEHKNILNLTRDSRSVDQAAGASTGHGTGQQTPVREANGFGCATRGAISEPKGLPSNARPEPSRGT
jgi:hypothetical protein